MASPEDCSENVCQGCAPPTNPKHYISPWRGFEIYKLFVTTNYGFTKRHSYYL